MTHASFLLVVGGAVVLACAAAVALLFGFVGVVKTTDRLAGVRAHRGALVRRGLHPLLAERIEGELSGAGMPALVAAGLAVAGVVALYYGVSTLSGMYAPELEEQLLYPAPGVVLLLVAAVVALRLRRLDVDRSELHRGLVTRASEAVAIVPTHVELWIDVSTLSDRVARERALQLRPIPHAIIRYRDGSELAVPAFDDQDIRATELVRALSAALPGAHVHPFTERASGDGAPLTLESLPG